MFSQDIHRITLARGRKDCWMWNDGEDKVYKLNQHIKSYKKQVLQINNTSSIASGEQRLSLLRSFLYGMLF